MTNTAKARCLISQAHDPWFNLATEDWIFRDMDKSHHILFLWRNDKTVVIGRNQNPWAECNLEKMEMNKVRLVRRQSGGGAVFQDLGNTNFTFLSSREAYDKKRNFQIIINALKRFGITAEMSGRNDLVVEGKKVSGSAFKENPDRAFHHGTLLINVNLGELAEYLTPAKKKLLAKGTTSVRSRVANLTEFYPGVSHEALTEAIITEFFKTYGAEKHVESLNMESLRTIPELLTYYEHLKSDEWRFGETPQFQHHLHERFDWATFDAHLDTQKGQIARAKIFSDCLNTELVEHLEKSLTNIAYNAQSVQKKMKELQETLPHHAEQIQEFSAWLAKEVA